MEPAEDSRDESSVAPVFEQQQVVRGLCEEAAAFASAVGRERLINISVAASGGTEFLGMGGTGVVIVWYREGG
jgi:hypothetical protein